jgi:hypothetical protein
MDGVVAAGSGVLHVTYHQFWLIDTEHQRQTLVRATNGLVGAGRGAALIHTGIHTGVVALSVEARDSAPGSVELDGWDEVAEVSLTAPVGRVRAAALEATLDSLPDLTVAGPGDYRVRVHARGRDTSIDGVASEPVEDYLVVVWPQTRADERIYKQTDGYGAGMRISVARAPIVPDPPVDEHQARLDAYLRQMRDRYLSPPDRPDAGRRPRPDP